MCVASLSTAESTWVTAILIWGVFSCGGEGQGASRTKGGGGTPATGGISTSGGTPATGGISSVGGTPSKGGSQPSGGTSTMGIIDSPSDVGGWPELKSLPAPIDSDHDGMPDDWEKANGLNPEDPKDRNQTYDPGYTMLEKYINGLVSF